MSSWSVFTIYSVCHIGQTDSLNNYIFQEKFDKFVVWYDKREKNGPKAEKDESAELAMMVRKSYREKSIQIDRFPRYFGSRAL